MPEAIGALILASIGVESITLIGSLTLASLVGYGALLGLSIGLQILLAPRPKVPSGESGHQALRQSIPPRISGYGLTVRLAGAYMLYEEFGGNSYDVQALHCGKMESISGYYLHDDRVVLDPDGFVYGVKDTTDDPTTTDPNPSQGDQRYSDGNIKINTRLGLATETAFAESSTIFSDIWSAADHRGDGQASSQLICAGVDSKDFQQTYPFGLPQLSVVAALSPIYDWRDASQKQGTVSTWKASENPVIGLADYLTNVDRGGMALPFSRLIAPVKAALAAEADICDQQVERRDGSFEKRYTVNGFFTHDTEPAAVIGMFLAACDGWMTQNGDGSIGLKVGQYRAPTVTLTEADCLGFSVQYGQSDENLVNEIDWSFVYPANDYKDTPGLPWRDEASISELGKTRQQSMQLTWVQSSSTGRRLVKRQMARLNPRLRVTYVTKLSGLRALGERWITINDARLADLSNLVVEVQKLNIDLANMQLSFDLVSIDPNAIDAFDPLTEEGDAPPIPDKVLNEVFTSPQAVAVTLGSNPTQGVYLVISFDDPAREDLSYLVQYRLADDGSGTATPGPWVQQAFQPVDAVSGRITINTVVVQSDTTYEVEVAFVGPRFTQSEFSFPAVSITTTVDPVAPGPPTGVGAVNATGTVTVSWTNPNSGNFDAARVWRGTTSFAASTDISGLQFGSPNQAMSFVDHPGIGTWKYWVTAENSSGVSSAAAGPSTVTV